MASINTVSRQRKLVLRAVLSKARLLDEKVQKAQATLRRLLSRKRLVPEASEYQTVIETVQAADAAMNEVVATLEAGSSIFNG